MRTGTTTPLVHQLICIHCSECYTVNLIIHPFSGTLTGIDYFAIFYGIYRIIYNKLHDCLIQSDQEFHFCQYPLDRNTFRQTGAEPFHIGSLIFYFNLTFQFFRAILAVIVAVLFSLLLLFQKKTDATLLSVLDQVTFLFVPLTLR